MKKILVLEEVAMTAAAIYVLLLIPVSFSAWWYLLFFFLPDIGMVGYLLNNKTGAFLYNLFHHKGLAILLAFTGYVVGVNYLIIIGVVLFGHASFDRVFGYGLKYVTGFKYTHLGTIK